MFINELKKELVLKAHDILAEEDLILLGAGTTVEAFIRYSKNKKMFTASSNKISAEIKKFGHNEIGLNAIERGKYVCIDGADQIIRGNLIIKGRGGAIYKERKTWAHARKIVILITEDKISDVLSVELPILIIPEYQEEIVKTLNFNKDIIRFELRKNENGELIYTDEKMNVIDLIIDQNSVITSLEKEVLKIEGVEEIGIFHIENYEDVDIYYSGLNGVKKL